MTYLKHLIFVVFLFMIVNMQAQINESDTARVQLNAGVNGIIQTGNVDLSIFRARADGVFKISSAFVFKTQNNGLYQTFGGRKSDLDLNSRNFLYFKPSKRWYPFAMLYAQSNFRLKLDQRIFYGLGTSFQVIRNPNHQLKLSVSWVYEENMYALNRFNENYYSGNSKITIHRPTFYISGFNKINASNIIFNYVLYIQSGIDKVENYRLHAESSLEFKLFKNLSLTAQYLYLFEKVIVSGTKQNDAILTFGIQYRFKK